MTYLLDTNIVSELRRPARTNAGVAEWAAKAPGDSAFVSVITLMELERGTLLAERNHPDLGAALRWWMTNTVLPTYLPRALPVTASIAMRAASFSLPEGRHTPDHLLAATAVEHGLTVVTRNVRHFQHSGVSVLNPFT